MPTTDFQYNPLPKQPTSFRLLRLLPRGHIVECELQDACLSDGKPYEALSYTWGNDEKVEPILVNNKTLWVTDNLHAALQHLSLPDSVRLLWVDGICIDQSNNAEKSQQVQRMGVIYSQAVIVIFWLGKSTAEINVLMQCLEALQVLLGRDEYTLERAQVHWTYVLESYGVRRQAEAGLRTLLERPWFSRIWVLQEVAHARFALLCAGPRSISADIFALAPILMNVGHRRKLSYWEPVIDLMPGVSREQSWWTKRPDLGTLMAKFSGSKATDSRDKVYALLSLSGDDRDRDSVTIDYARPAHELYQNVFRYLMQIMGYRVDHILNIAAATPSLGTILVVVQQDGASDTISFECKRRRLETDRKASQSQKRRRDFLPEVYDSRDIPTVAISTSSAHIYCLDPAAKATLYSEVLSMFTDYRKEAAVNAHPEGRPDVGHWGSREQGVKLLVLKAKVIHDMVRWALARGYASMFKLLFDLHLVNLDGVEYPSCDGYLVLYKAISKGSAVMVATLLNVGVSPKESLWEDKGVVPVCVAAFKGYTIITELLIDHGADVNASLRAAISNQQWRTIALSIRRGANFEQNRKVLQHAYRGLTFTADTAKSRTDDCKMCFRLFLENGADPNWTLSIGLLGSADDISMLPIELALDYGADPNLLAKYLNDDDFEIPEEDVGKSMLQLAVEKCSPVGVIEVLLERGANINLVSEHPTFKTALHSALASMRPRTVELLLRNGALVDREALSIIASQLEYGSNAREDKDWRVLWNLLQDTRRHGIRCLNERSFERRSVQSSDTNRMGRSRSISSQSKSCWRRNEKREDIAKKLDLDVDYVSVWANKRYVRWMCGAT